MLRSGGTVLPKNASYLADTLQELPNNANNANSVSAAIVFQLVLLIRKTPNSLAPGKLALFRLLVVRYQPVMYQASFVEGARYLSPQERVSAYLT